MKLKTLFAAAAIAVAAACGNDGTSPPFSDIGPPPPLPAGAQTVALPSGLQVADIQAGTGATAQVGNRVQVRYTGWLAAAPDRPFDSSRERAITVTLGAHSVIEGFEEGILGMRVGGKRRLVIPPALAYGAEDVRDRNTGRVVIPANSTLIFDVDLVALTP